jgi:hypothetical protein
MTTENPQARILRLATARDTAQRSADELGSELRQVIRDTVSSGLHRPSEIARWLEVTPQYINKVLHSDH